MKQIRIETTLEKGHVSSATYIIYNPKFKGRVIEGVYRHIVPELGNMDEKPIGPGWFDVKFITSLEFQ